MSIDAPTIKNAANDIIAILNGMKHTEGAAALGLAYGQFLASMPTVGDALEVATIVGGATTLMLTGGKAP